MSDILAIYMIMLLLAFIAMVVLLFSQIVSFLVLGLIARLCPLPERRCKFISGRLFLQAVVCRLIAVPCLVLIKYGVELLVDGCVFDYNPASGSQYLVFYGGILYILIAFPSVLLYGSAYMRSNAAYRFVIMAESFLSSLLYVWLGDMLFKAL